MGKAGMRDLVLKIREGDNTAFDELYRLTNQQAYFIALKITRTKRNHGYPAGQLSKGLERISQLRDPESFSLLVQSDRGKYRKEPFVQGKPFLFARMRMWTMITC
jgi:hypothetical protein